MFFFLPFPSIKNNTISYSPDQDHKLSHTFILSSLIMLQLDEGSFLFYFISPLFPTYLSEQILFLGILFLPLPPLYVEFICTVHPNSLAALPSGHVHTFILPSGQKRAL